MKKLILAIGLTVVASAAWADRTICGPDGSCWTWIEPKKSTDTVHVPPPPPPPAPPKKDPPPKK